MRRGAIAMIDALGFRGIWKPRKGETPPVRAEQVLAKLRKLTEASAEHETRDNEVLRSLAKAVGIDVQTSTTFLSDTIVVGGYASTTATTQDQADWTAIYRVALRVAYLLDLAVRDDPHLAYRGCISFGDFVVDGPFLVGPAVDDAASMYEVAEAGLVWLAPSALKVMGDDPVNDPIGHLLPSHRVPTKIGPFDTRVVSPFVHRPSASDRGDFIDRSLATFEGALAVQIKRQNTAAFLYAERDRLLELEAQ